MERGQAYPVRPLLPQHFKRFETTGGCRQPVDIRAKPLVSEERPSQGFQRIKGGLSALSHGVLNDEACHFAGMCYDHEVRSALDRSEGGTRDCLCN